jgi:hypothetical protein
VAKAETAPKKDEPKAQPKAKKEVVAAVKEVAKEAGVPEKTLTEEAMTLFNQLQGMSNPKLDKLNALIAQQVSRAEEIKGRGLSDALMNFGFTMAAEASKPGARFLESASRAAPEITKTMGENQKAVEAAQDAFNKAQIEQLRNEITGSGQDMRTSLTTAQAIMRDRLEQKRMAQDADYRNRSLAMRAAEAGAREPNVYDIARTIMADPAFKGSERDALTEAYAIKNGVAMRTQARLLEKANAEIDEAIKVDVLARNQATNPQDKAKYQANIDRLTREINARYGIGAPAGGGGGTVLKFDAKGNQIQ